MDNPKTPYQKGYKAGRNDEPREPEVYKTPSDYAAYVMGYGYGAQDRETECIGQ